MSTMMVPTWILVMNGLLAPIIAAFGAYIAFRQHCNARTKLKLDLFEKRWTVLQAVRKFLGLVARDANIDSEELLQLRRDTFEAKFLFGDDIAKYVDAIFKKGVELHTTSMILKDLPVGEKRSKTVDANTQTLTWLMEQITTMEKKFLKYFDFRKL